MRVLRAEVTGMCFGVRDALQVIERIEDPGEISIHGQLVHNEVVLRELAERGFALTGESEDERKSLSERSTALITAHGVSDREFERLETAGKKLIDTTCPLVRRAHRAALTLERQGYHVLVIGRRGHVEVRGIVGDLRSFDVLESEDEVRRYSFDRLGIICQTTATARNVERIRAAVAVHNPGAEIKFIDTVCLPTKEHQRSLEHLLGYVDVMVIVGGKNSNNTLELVNLCRERGVAAFHVQGAGDLDPGWFDVVATVGLAAGTSTLDETIQEVHEALERLRSRKYATQELLTLVGPEASAGHA